MQLPSPLIDAIRRGEVVLFLGAGASWGARNTKSETPPSGQGLADLLARKFLSEKYVGKPLAQVSELAMSHADQSSVERFIQELYQSFEPADFHRQLPLYKWNAIITTNYDQVVEKAYGSARDAVQNLQPWILNSDKVDTLMRTPNSVLYVKLHGCVTRVGDTRAPLILTPEQYLKHKQNRQLLFNYYEAAVYQHTIVFIGYSLQDYNVFESLMRSNEELGQHRPRHYIVRPDIDEIEAEYHNSRRMTPLIITFEAFVQALDQAIPKHTRNLSHLVSVSRPIEARFIKQDSLRADTVRLLDVETEYVHAGLALPPGTPRDFYRGFNFDWYPIANDLDVKRRLTRTMLSDVIDRDGRERPSLADLYPVLAPAGAGKSVFLRRLAWEAATAHNALCLFKKDEGQLEFDAIEQLHRMTGERIFLFVDDAPENVPEIEDLVRLGRKQRVPLTVITAARMNEWNVTCERLEAYVGEKYNLTRLSETEAGQLIKLLEKHGALGRIQHLSPEERVQQFVKHADRQLLVALHEATQGRPFEDIIKDEYDQIHPEEARHLYLGVSTLHRLNVPVRAGLIARVFNIPFSEFEDRLFKPLTHVVDVHQHSVTGDFLYRTRHPQIAQIVFDRVLSSPDSKFDEYMRLLAHLNLGYETDYEAFRALIAYRNLLDLFPDPEHVDAIFKTALTLSNHDASVFHQRGLYEMNRANASLEAAEGYLLEARERKPENLTIVHSLAELMLRRAERHPLSHKKEFYLREAEKLASPLLNSDKSRRPAMQTLIKVALTRLERSLREEAGGDELNRAIESVQRQLDRAQQEYPGDERFVEVEARFSRLLEDSEGVEFALRRANSLNPSNAQVALRLARWHAKQGARDVAREVIKAALTEVPNNKNLHYEYAMQLRLEPTVDPGELLYHLRKAFTMGDKNLEAQFWYARYAHEFGTEDEREKSRAIFQRLREAPVGPEVKRRVRDYAQKAGKKRTFAGKLVQKRGEFGFIESDNDERRLFIGKDTASEEMWEQLSLGARVQFAVGFAFSGPVATDIEIIG